MSPGSDFGAKRLLAASLTIFAVCAGILAGCPAPAMAPTSGVVEVPTLVVEKVVTQVVEKEVEKVVEVTRTQVAPATAAPAALQPTATPLPSRNAPRMRASPPPTHAATPSPTPDPSIPTFPWPPPDPSVLVVVPVYVPVDPQRPPVLDDIDAVLLEALDACGYSEKAYFSVPGGFALVTRLEQIEADGKPLDPPDRWSTDVKAMRKFSLAAYLQALFTATPGHYRIIAFVVTGVPITEKGPPPDEATAQGWLDSGSNTLPSAVSEQPVMKDLAVTALIYQFEQPGPGREPELVHEDAIPGRQHLEKALLWARLVR